MANYPTRETNGVPSESKELSMAMGTHLGERLNGVLFGDNSTFDSLNTASVFSTTPSDIDLLYGRRRRDEPPRLLTQEQKNYLENFRNWSEQLPRKGEEEVIKPAEGQTLAEKPADPVADDRSEAAEEEEKAAPVHEKSVII